MCGIAGITKLNGDAADPAAVMAMVSMLQHRGPDDSNVWTSGGVALGHARLSIIDLAGGAQPMSNGDGTIWITFNGEIFNYIELREDLSKKGHIFLTRSDTEVILAAYREYGEDCVHRFNGQWAFALWDAPERKLFLSQDRLGVRPLFYTSTPKCFAFASEAKALFACTEISPPARPARPTPDFYLLGDAASAHRLQEHLAAAAGLLTHGQGRQAPHHSILEA